MQESVSNNQVNVDDDYVSDPEDTIVVQLPRSNKDKGSSSNGEDVSILDLFPRGMQ